MNRHLRLISGAKAAEEVVVIIDPGMTTGVAWVPLPCEEEDLAEHVNSFEVKVEAGDEIAAADDIVYVLQELRRQYGKLIVIGEDFILRQFSMDRSLLYPVRMWARIETLLYVHSTWEEWDNTIIDTQPSSAMSVINDKRLRALGLWAVGTPHARAALKHLVVYLRKRLS